MEQISTFFRLTFAIAGCWGLAACGNPALPTAELQTLKGACAGGDTAACSEIGHSVRAQRDAGLY